VAIIVRFDAYEVDLAGGQILKRGKRLVLREQAFRVLAALLERPGEVVTREELHHRLWPGQVFVDFDNVLNTAVAKLREVLGDSANHGRFIETVPKHGYRFIAKVSTLPAPAESETGRARLVVLPFLNSNPDPEEEYFSDAITEEVITALAALAPDRLGVIARTTAMRYKATAKDVAQIGRDLNVDYVVEGTVRPHDGRATVTVQLIRVTDQTHLLARRYEAGLQDVFDLRHIIAEAVADQIGVGSRSAASRRPRKPTQDVVAYNLYLRGRVHFDNGTPERMEAAKRCFEEAISRDPDFTLAYSALAEVYWYVGFLGIGHPHEAAAAGVFYAMRALAIDNDLADTHALLAMYAGAEGVPPGPLFDWAEAKREIDRARELDATSPLVRLRYAMMCLLIECRLKDAAAEIEMALDSDPQSTFLRGWLGCMLWLDRQYDRAAEQARLIVELDPASPNGPWLLGMVIRDQGRFDESIAAHRAAVHLSGGSPLMLGWLGLALGQGGHAADARALLEQLHAMANARYVPPTSFAWTHYGLGEIDQAFLWMDRAVDGCDRMMAPLQSYPFLDPIRADPRYVALLKKMNYRTEGAGAYLPPHHGAGA